MHAENPLFSLRSALQKQNSVLEQSQFLSFLYFLKQIFTIDIVNNKIYGEKEEAVDTTGVTELTSSDLKFSVCLAKL